MVWRPFMRQMHEIVETRSILDSCIPQQWQEPQNGFAPNSHGRRVSSFAQMRLNVKVKGQGHQGQKTRYALRTPHGVNGMERLPCR